MSTVEVEARRRLELDLHDGAQEQLVVAALTLRRAAAQVRGTAGEHLVGEAFDHLQEGLAKLRDLGREIYPYVLTHYGLAPALEGLAARASQPTELHITHERMEAAVEAAIYFAVAEALANVTKHAHATRATITVARTGGALVAEVADDGIGGATLVDGSGLRSIAQRVEALSGRLELDSPPRSGTRLRVILPL